MTPQLVLALSVTFEERVSKKKRILKAPVLVILWCGVCGGFVWIGGGGGVFFVVCGVVFVWFWWFVFFFKLTKLLSLNLFLLAVL